MSTSFIKDPIHDNIEFDQNEQWVLEIIETLEFKRLKRISQLGECYLIFPSANHTRFSHSLGVYHLAKQFLNALNVNSIKQRNVVLAAALLHDIGHGPRSHSFELYTGYKHENMSIKIIKNKNGEIYKKLVKNDIDVDEVVSIINKKHMNKWMVQIVSSQIDADRLDYLLRDSYHSGVAYGKSVDYEFLFKKVFIKNNQIVFDKKVINLIETILFARQQMFKQLYTNIHVLCYEAIMIKVFERWKYLYKNNFKFKDCYGLYHLFDSFLNDKEWDINNFLQLNEDTYNLVLQSLWLEKDNILKNLLDSYFIKNHYVLKENKTKKPDYSLYEKEFYSKTEPIFIEHNYKLVEIINKSEIVSQLTKKSKKINYSLVKHNII